MQKDLTYLSYEEKEALAKQEFLANKAFEDKQDAIREDSIELAAFTQEALQAAFSKPSAPQGGGGGGIVDVTLYKALLDLANESLATLTYAATIALDFNAASVQTLIATGNVVLATPINMVPLKTKELYITNTTASAITLYFPSGWTFFSGSVPSSIAAGAQVVIYLRSLGTTDSNIKARFFTGTIIGTIKANNSTPS